MGWWQQLNTDRSRDAEKAGQLVNVLGRMPGSCEAKMKWLVKLLPLLEAEAGKKFDPEQQPREFGAEMVSLAYRYWRAKVKGRRAQPGSTELPQQQGERGEELTPLADILPLFESKQP